MKFLLAGLTLVLGCSAVWGQMIGGFPLAIEKAPYTIQLRKNNDFAFCGGSLVDKLYVVTAAHCVDGITKDEFKLVGGASSVNEHGVQSRVAKIWVHPHYNKKNMDNDIAVLKLATPMQSWNIRPIKLCSKQLQKNDKVQVSGWGLTEENGDASADLLTAILTIVDKKDCLQMYKDKRFNIKIGDSQICAYDGGVMDACSGDSGGPAVHNDELCGVVSWGVGCARTGYPGMYTSVYSMLDFITKSMNE